MLLEHAKLVELNIRTKCTTCFGSAVVSNVSSSAISRQKKYIFVHVILRRNIASFFLHNGNFIFVSILFHVKELSVCLTMYTDNF